MPDMESAKAAVEAFCGRQFDDPPPAVQAAIARLIGRGKGEMPLDIAHLLAPFRVPAKENDHS